jgi:hypothetical protein
LIPQKQKETKKYLLRLFTSSPLPSSFPPLPTPIFQLLAVSHLNLSEEDSLLSTETRSRLQTEFNPLRREGEDCGENTERWAKAVFDFLWGRQDSKRKEEEEEKRKKEEEKRKRKEEEKRKKEEEEEKRKEVEEKRKRKEEEKRKKEEEEKRK